MISCLSMMFKTDEKKQSRGFRFRAAFSFLVLAGLMLLVLRAAQAQEAHLVKDINLSGSSNPQFLTDVNGTLYFSATDALHGTELWKSDGTADGTVMVKDINPGIEGSNPENLVQVSGVLYFSAPDALHGTELWKSDGTADGTVMVEDINPGIEGSNPENLVQVGGVLYFSATDAVHGTELWNLGGNTIDTAAGDEYKGCFIVTAGDAWSSRHDIEALRKSKGGVLFTVRASEVLAQLYQAWSPVISHFITTCNVVRTVLLLGLFLITFSIRTITPENWQ
jgi:ELWxxDGT repeat protein